MNLGFGGQIRSLSTSDAAGSPQRGHTEGPRSPPPTSPPQPVLRAGVLCRCTLPFSFGQLPVFR